jgi:hypothetical protein
MNIWGLKKKIERIKFAIKKEKEIEKPRGWANLQQQLKEIREESFKQGVWAGQNSQKEKDLEIIKEFLFDYDLMKGNDDEYCFKVSEWRKLKQKIKEMK